MKNKKFYYLSHDLVFKYIFGTNSNKRFTQRFIELYLDEQVDSLNDIKILNSVKLIPNNIKTRKLEMDVLVYIPKTNTKIVLEMQDKFNEDTFTKCFIYICSLIFKEYKSGEKGFISTDKIKEVIITKHVCNAYTDIEDRYFLTGLRKLRKLLRRLIDIDIINVAKYDVRCYNKNIKELEMWYMLIEADTNDKLKEIWRKSKDYPMIREAIIEMKKFNKVLYGQEYWLNDALYMTELERKYDEGIYKGSSNKQYEIAKNLLENTNTSLEDISKCTGLSLKEIYKLQS